MTNAPTDSFHTVDSEWLGAYSSGSISDAKRLVIDCQMALQPKLTSQIERIDGIGGAFVETAKGEPLSSDFTNNLALAISAAESNTARVQGSRSQTGRTEDWLPEPLKDFLDQSDIKLIWRKSGPGVERAELVDDGEDRLYLLRAQPGLKLPLHSHRGQEWTLILQGGYHVGDKGYGRGDLHGEDETCTHQPVIDNDGEPCISLVADEGRLVFRNPFMKLLQPLIGI